MDGKRVLAPEKDIQEVRNAILAYEQLSSWKPWKLNDLLSAHRILMAGLVDNPGMLRKGDVGVYRGSQLVHMAPPASQMNRLMDDLLGWLKETDLHPLIASSVFHYEFEFIHPFSDGNGRMGRLWQTLILSHWRPELAWLPVETLIHFQQARYYKILGECDRASDCTAFIEFMLQNIAEALREGIAAPLAMSEEMSEEMSEKESSILQLLTVQPKMTTAMLASVLGVTPRTVERYISTLQMKGKLKREGAKKGGSWQVMR
jgi:Fic family protein